MKKILLKLLLFFFCNLTFCQIQVGNTVFSEINDDYFIGGVAINDLGNIVAVAADGTDTANGGSSGLVRVFELNNNQWLQKGNNILGDNAGDLFGAAMALNSNGNLLAISAPNNDNASFQSGEIKVFEFNDTTSQWIQKGSNIYNGLPDYFTGKGLSFNESGTRLAIGTPVTTSNGTHKGNIVVFDFDNSANDWVQVGSTIFGTQNYVNLGYSVALNGSGDVLIAGGPGQYRSGNDPINGVVKAFELVNNTWVQKGVDIVGTQLGNYFGVQIDINNNGNIIIVGSPLDDTIGNNSGKVDIFEFNGTNWVQKGTSILGESEDRIGSSVAIDDIGDKILAGSSGFNNKGKVELFEFNTSNWSLIGSSIIGDSNDDRFGASASMTSDGNYIVSSTFRNDDTNNYFKVFETSDQSLHILEKNLNNLNLYFLEKILVISSHNISIRDISIYNSLGQNIEFQTEKSDTLKVKFSDFLSTGIYFIKLSTDKGVISKKVLFNNN